MTGISYDGIDSNGSVDWGGVCNAKIWKHNFGITISVSFLDTSIPHPYITFFITLQVYFKPQIYILYPTIMFIV